MGNKILIQNGYLVNPGTGQEGYADIIIEDGKIAQIRFLSEGASLDAAPVSEDTQNVDNSGTEVIDAKGLYIFPGLVDAHSHFRDPGFTYKEDILSGAEAAAAGGYTDVVLMCNTNPVVDNRSCIWMPSATSAETAHPSATIRAARTRTSSPCSADATISRTAPTAVSWSKRTRSM